MNPFHDVELYPLIIPCYSAGLFIKTERSRKPSYSFKDYQEGIIQEGTQERSEQELLKGGQGPYKHTRKEAISMVAKQIVSNDPKLHKVSLIYKHSFLCTIGTWSQLRCD